MSESHGPAQVPFLPLEGETAASVFQCPLCSGRFTHGALACTGCPLHAGCEVVKCPHCGYQSPRRSQIVDWVRGLFGRRGSS